MYQLPYKLDVGIAMESHLRSECKNLLSQLATTQKLLKDKLHPADRSLKNGDTLASCVDTASQNVSSRIRKDVPGDINSGNFLSDLKSSHARNRLSSLSMPTQSSMEDNYVKNYDAKRQYAIGLESSCTNSKEGSDTHKVTEIQQGMEVLKEKNDSTLERADTFNLRDNQSLPSSSCRYLVTPNTLRKRQLIDRHTSVPSKLSTDELKELNNEQLLNFNYSHISLDGNVSGLKTLSLNEDNKEIACDTIRTVKNTSKSAPLCPTQDTEKSTTTSKETFKEQLKDQGNSRQHNNWLKETVIKPKSILNSSSYYSLCSFKKNNSRVSFDSSRKFDSPAQDQRLLGYDWIAALLENDSHLMDQSESFFDDIRDFRKAFKDECSNQFYMESPYTLVDSEPQSVVEALIEPKVRPYVVNERLFTEPLKPHLIDNEEDQNCKRKEDAKEPTQENPRFVRVSIPRSTLQTPYRVKPHRRGSFDGKDSCALMDHCLLGWENTRPIMLPSAKSLDLNSEAGTRIDSETTTLAEAERLANEHNRAQWPFAKPSARLRTLPTWRKHYMDTTLNLSLPQSSGSTANLSGDQSWQGRACVKRATDRILRATYSTMYEMERLRQERELEKHREEEERKL